MLWFCLWIHRIRFQGFDDRNFKKEIQLKNCFPDFWQKIENYLSIGLRKGRPSYRRSYEIYWLYSIYVIWVIFALLDLNPGDSTESGSNPDPDPQHWNILWITCTNGHPPYPGRAESWGHSDSPLSLQRWQSRPWSCSSLWLKQK